MADSPQVQRVEPPRPESEVGPPPFIPRQDRGPERSEPGSPPAAGAPVAPWDVPLTPANPPLPRWPRWVLVWLVTVVLLAGTVVALGLLAGRGRPGTTSPYAESSRCVLASRVIPCPLTPERLRTAYNVTPLLDRGIDGRGRTITLLETPASPATPAVSNIYEDLAAYSQMFHLPPASLSVDAHLVAVEHSELADDEEAMDAQIVHAIAPAAHIRVLLVRADSSLDAGSWGDVLSISMVVGERCRPPAGVASMHQLLERITGAGTTVVASSGDLGVVGTPCDRSEIVHPPVVDVSLPATDPLVTAVGGTRLAVTSTGRYLGETVWNNPPRPPSPDRPPEPFGAVPHSSGPGGGFSRHFPRPDYQQGVVTAPGGRAIPDVAADADPVTGIVVVHVLHGRRTLGLVGGTSAGAPLWAGLVALADQQAGRRLGPLNPALYRIARSPDYHLAFHDVTSGENGTTFPEQRFPGYRAGAGWDASTGLGSPNAEQLIPRLITPGP